MKISRKALALLTAMSLVGTQIAFTAEADSFSATLGSGYRAVDARDNHRRAAEYTLLESGPTFSGVLNHSRGQGHLFLDAKFLNESEYSAEGHLDYKGLVRLVAFADGLYHNLEHIPYDSRPSAHVSGIERIPFDDANPGDNYFVEVEQAGARLRAKYPGIPAHLNLSYWRLERSGRQQLRYLKEGEGFQGTPCASCHMQSKSREIDRLTEEVTFGIDANLGPINIAVEQLIREIDSREPIPLDTFNDHYLRTSGSYQHDVAADSRLTQTAVQIYTDLSGGLTGAASFALGERENRSDLSDVRPVESETDFRKIAGNMTYIPGEHWLLAFRYRLLDLDTDNSDRIVADGLIFSLPSAIPPVDRNPLAVRDSIDLSRAFYHATLSYRPSAAFSLKGDYRREEIHRGNTGPAIQSNAFNFTDPATITIDPVWELPENETIDRWRLSFLARPLKSRKTRITAWYQYISSDDPAYGTSVGKGHKAFASLLWTPSAHWGSSLTAQGATEENERHRMSLFASSAGTFNDFRLDRRSERLDVTAGAWVSPLESVFLSLQYGFFRLRTLQDLLYGREADTVIVDEKTEYSQRTHTAIATMNLRILDSLTARGEAHWTDSFAQFDPGFPTTLFVFETSPPPLEVSSSDLKEITELDLRQMGFALGLEWAPNDSWSLAARYSFDDYDDRHSDVFDGAAHIYSVQLARTW